MNKILWLILAVAMLAAAVFGIVMTVMAVRFLEYGRVIFYGLIAIVCLEIMVIALLKSKNS
jgi:ABC-type branched-subunit amino acid transport system permease subunit